MHLHGFQVVGALPSTLFTSTRWSLQCSDGTSYASDAMLSGEVAHQ